jgi:hypothetical protein
MQRKQQQSAGRRVVTIQDIEAAAKSLALSVERLRTRNEAMRAYLDGAPLGPTERVANAPETDLEDATERARRYWDKLEGRRSSVPPNGAAK